MVLMDPLSTPDDRYTYWDPYQQRRRDFRWLNGRELQMLLRDAEMAVDRETVERIRAYLAETEGATND